MTQDKHVTKEEVEKLIDSRFEAIREERMRNQRMLNSLQEEVEKLRELVDGSGEVRRGNRSKIELEHKVMRAIAIEIDRSSKNVADPNKVLERIKEAGELKTFASMKIDELVDQGILIEQGSGDLVFMNPDFEDIALIDRKYGDF